MLFEFYFLNVILRLSSIWNDTDCLQYNRIHLILDTYNLNSGYSIPFATISSLSIILLDFMYDNYTILPKCLQSNKYNTYLEKFCKYRVENMATFLFSFHPNHQIVTISLEMQEKSLFLENSTCRHLPLKQFSFMTSILILAFELTKAVITLISLL